jgi:DNA-directed RNA polymerase subunit M/transcription elongation factor TFIIS
MAYKNKEDAKKWRENNKEKIKEYNRNYHPKWYQDNKERQTKLHKEWQEKNPLKQREYSKKSYYKNGDTWTKGDPELIKLRRKTRSLVDNGTIEKKDTCEHCGHKGDIYRIEKHHLENNPFSIVWLCSKCHKNLHAGNIKL